MNEAEKELKKENRKLKKYLNMLSNAVLIHLYMIDTTIGNDRTVPNRTGKYLAKLCNRLDFTNDEIRYFALNLKIDENAKKKHAKKLLNLFWGKYE